MNAQFIALENLEAVVEVVKALTTNSNVITAYMEWLYAPTYFIYITVL